MNPRCVICSGKSPDGVKTTALYPITIEKQGWRISDISGGVAPIPGK
ncbi:hypothetical protein [Gordonia bronchialis]|nr:hypothetical protein [Gordonia bronchialis]